jgi:anaerobic selenocysteine-containing dehydrogenase
MHPEDAARVGVANGELVEVASRRGQVSVKADVTDKIQPGVVFMTFHFPDSAANFLTNPALDPVAKIPEFKACAVKVSKIPAES